MRSSLCGLAENANLLAVSFLKRYPMYTSRFVLAVGADANDMQGGGDPGPPQINTTHTMAFWGLRGKAQPYHSEGAVRLITYECDRELGGLSGTAEPIPPQGLKAGLFYTRGLTR